MLVCIFGIFSNKYIDYIQTDYYELEDNLHTLDQCCRFHKLEVYMQFIDTLFLTNHIKISKQQVVDFFKIDTVSYLENVGGNPDILQVVGLPCYFAFEKDTLKTRSLLYFKPLHQDIDSFIKYKNIYSWYIPKCID